MKKFIRSVIIMLLVLVQLGGSYAFASLQDEFMQAQHESKYLPDRPDYNTLLRIYALFKQGSVGNCEGPRPAPNNFVERAKWDTWCQLRGMNREQAQLLYIQLIESLK